MRAEDIIQTMEAMRDDVQRKVLMRFFRTGKGEYGEGDEFLGIKVPQTRALVKEIAVSELSFEELHLLLVSKWHEVRLCGFLLLVKWVDVCIKQNKPGKKKLSSDMISPEFDEIVRFYLDHADNANNWDLVDLSTPRIVGRWLMMDTGISIEEKQKTIEALILSDHLWRQRIAMVSTWWTSREGDLTYVWRYAEMLLEHPHDLMHKAVGWMLREAGKSKGVVDGKNGMDLLRDFLEQHIHQMPRTTLRYAIERMSPSEKQYWMSIPIEKRKK